MDVWGQGSEVLGVFGSLGGGDGEVVLDEVVEDSEVYFMNCWTNLIL